MTKYTGATLKATLATIEGNTLPDSLWAALPDTVAGPRWCGEVADAAITLSDWLTDSEEYDIERLQDMAGQLANSEVEDYYSNINRRVQELSLWADSDLDSLVGEIQGDSPVTLTDLNSLYLYVAMERLYQILMIWAIDTAAELEEVA